MPRRPDGNGAIRSGNLDTPIDWPPTLEMARAAGTTVARYIPNNPDEVRRLLDMLGLTEVLQ